MPELPEVETIRKGLAKTIVGKRIVAVSVRLPKIVALGPATVSNKRSNGRAKAAKFAALITGHRIVSVKRRAKMLILDLSGPYTLFVHLKMTGQLIYAKKNEQKLMKIFNAASSRRLLLPHEYTHVIFRFTDGSRLYYNDLRQFGYLRLVPDSEIGNVRELALYGPEPLSRDFTLAYLKAKARSRPRAAVKLFLMDPAVVAGIGNIYSDEILYRAGIRPERPARDLAGAKWKKLFAAIAKVLKEGLVHHGSSVGDYFRVDGSEGTYGRVHRVYGRGGERCRRCQSVIKTVKLGGRTGSYCPKCQK